MPNKYCAWHFCVSLRLTHLAKKILSIIKHPIYNNAAFTDRRGEEGGMLQNASTFTTGTLTL